VLRFPLIHPPLLRALAAAGHGSQVLIADANYAHATNINPRAELVHLNLRPGLINSDDVLETLLAAVPVEAAHVMATDDGSTPKVWPLYARHLDMVLYPLPRNDSYDASRTVSFSVCIAS